MLHAEIIDVVEIYLFLAAKFIVEEPIKPQVLMNIHCVGLIANADKDKTHIPSGSV